MSTFLARQPMMNVDNDVVGYELLFRNSKDNKASFTDGYTATLNVMKNLIVNFGIKEMTNNKRFFINFNEELILQGAPDLFSPEELVIEILEDTLANEKLIEILMEYKSKGYTIALDDFYYSEENKDLIGVADIIKLDFFEYTKDELLDMVDKLKPYDLTFLAEKVEDIEMFEFGQSIGCTIFQGYYFQRPVIFESSDPMTIPTVYYELLDELNKDEVDYEVMATIIQKDTALTLSLLKLLNSPAYYTQKRITSVKSALVSLGLKESKKLIMINMLKNLTTAGTPDELINISLRRGKQAEKLADYYNLKHRRDELFLVGMLSLINVIMKKHMESVLKDVRLQEDVIEALLGSENDLSKVLNLIVCYETEVLDRVTDEMMSHNIMVEEFNQIYIESTKWADNIWH